MNVNTKKPQQPLNADEWVGLKPERSQLNVTIPDDLIRLFHSKIAANNLANKEKVTMADIVRQAIKDYCDK